MRRSACPEACLGLVLAGGRSRRMGGPDKALAVLGGATLAERVLDRLAPQCAALALSANTAPARFAHLGFPVLGDDVPGLPGPLAGILAGLEHIAATRPDLDGLVSVAVDTPFLPADLARRLRGAADAARTGLACAASGGRRHPVVAFWRRGFEAPLRAALVERGERRVSAFLDRHGCTEVHWPATPHDPFFNVNTPEDLAEAEAMLHAGAVTPCG